MNGFDVKHRLSVLLRDSDLPVLVFFLPNVTHIKYIHLSVYLSIYAFLYMYTCIHTHTERKNWRERYNLLIIITADCLIYWRPWMPARLLERQWERLNPWNIKEEKETEGENDKCVPHSHTPDPYYLLTVHGSLGKLLNPRMVEWSEIKKRNKKRTVFITFQYRSVHTKAWHRVT